MSVNKKKKIMIIVVIAAVTVFAVSALAAGLNLSGYERLKAAGFRFAEEFSKDYGAYSNGTFYINSVFFVDGVEHSRNDQIIMSDGDRNLTFNYSYDSISVYNGIPLEKDAVERTTVMYADKDITYMWHNGDHFFESAKTGYNTRSYVNDDLGMPAQRRFIEAVADALIGETRNFFINDGNFVSISLSGNQIPEIAQYAIAAFAESESYYSYDDEEAIFGPDARFSKGSLEVELNDDELVTGAKVSIEVLSTVNGAPREYRVEITYRSKNIGTTVIDKPDGNKNGAPAFPAYDDDGPLGAAYVSGADVS